MSGYGQAPPAQGIGWRRPAPGGLVAAAGGAVTLTSLFLPWYSVRLRVSDYASMSTFALIHIHGGDQDLSCDPLRQACHDSLSVGALAAGVWDWRTLMAVGSAAIAMYVVIGAQTGSAARRRRDWQVLIALAASTALVTLAAVAVSPVSVPASAARLGLSSSLAYGGAVGLAGALAALIGGLLLWWTERGTSKGARLSVPIPQA